MSACVSATDSWSSKRERGSSGPGLRSESERKTLLAIILRSSKVREGCNIEESSPGTVGVATFLVTLVIVCAEVSKAYDMPAIEESTRSTRVEKPPKIIPAGSEEMLLGCMTLVLIHQSNMLAFVAEGATVMM